MNNTPEKEFDHWFSETHGGTENIQTEDDLPIEDAYGDPLDYNGL